MVLAGAKSAGTSPIGASFFVATTSPEFRTPQRPSPTMNPEATSVPRRSARSALGPVAVRLIYQWLITAPTTTAYVADIGR